MPRDVIGMVMLLISLIACSDTRSAEPSPLPKPEEDLTVTFGGFLQNGPEDQRLDGQCTPNATRDVLQCDVHNGLMKWHVTELTLQVIRTSDKDGDRHYYKERVSIDPLETGTVNFKLALQLPADSYIPTRDGTRKVISHWDWLIVGAKGQQVD